MSRQPGFISLGIVMRPVCHCLELYNLFLHLAHKGELLAENNSHLDLT